ncbi:FAD-dependent oxidoreductase [Roseomonas elaeocarpi]|uniref:Thioredoxin reductase n=1 Tax=Roseomonas elaeocarpi TaxID=907779 RepID=A0ABV6JZ42_9PROT
MSTLSMREHQMFPVLDAAQIETARRFASGPARRFAPGETIYAIAERDAPAWLVLEGAIDVMRRDGLSLEAPITTHRAGQFSGEVNQLAGRPSIAAGLAGPDGCVALPFDPAHLRALMVGSADVGELVMRALILRRVSLIEEGGAGTILIGVPGSPDLVRLQGFLARSGFPNLVLDAGAEGEGRALVERTGMRPDELPLVVCPSGALLRRPGEAELAACLGLTPTLDPAAVYDVAVVGAGPAGLATAVYAASEGLSVIVLDEHATGGQAGASARIENYLGFPTGISGQALAGRAVNQALKFGAEIVLPVRIEGLDCSGPLLTLQLEGDRRIEARAIVVASGARYRRPDIPDLASFEGAGISYWATPVEARLCAGEEIALVGGGNSAGQAVVFLAPKVKRLHLVVRRPLKATMSRYLIDRIAALPNVEIHVGTEITQLEGDRASGLSAAVFIRHSDGGVYRRALRHIFLFIGADPNSGWLQHCVEVDAKGFVVTGMGTLPLETSRPGVFAIGDVRAGSTKRVAAAVGEGAAVVAQIHAMIAQRAKEPA